MNFKRVFSKEYVCFILMVIFSTLLTLKMIEFHLSGSILNPDTSLYLLSGLKYVNLDVYNVVDPQDLFYTPIISFLSSIFFFFGITDKTSIIIVTGVFGYMGFIGLYFLLKRRFNPLLSLTGVVIYGSLSIIIFNLAKGLIDLPSTAVSIWVLYFAIKAIDENPKYFLVTFPLLTFGFFVKYIVGFILPLIVYYFLINKDIIDMFDNFLSSKKIKLNFFKSQEFYYLIISITISLIIAIIICKYLILDFGGSLSFFQQSYDTFNGNIYSGGGINYDENKLFYFEQFSNILFDQYRPFNSILSWILYGILGFGCFINLTNIINSNLNFKFSFKTKYLKYLLFIVVFLSIIIITYGFWFYSNHMLVNLTMMVFFIILFTLLHKLGLNKNSLSLDLLFLLYFSLLFIFMSLYPTKVIRYSIPFIPPFIYFVIWSLESIFNLNFNKLNLSFVPVLLIIIFSLSTLIFIAPMEIEQPHHPSIDFIEYKGFVNDLKNVTDYIIENDDNYHSKTFASYYHHSRTIRWYLKVNVTILSEDDSNLEYMDNSSYIILNEMKDFKNYHKIYNCGDFYLYSHD